MSKKSNKKQHKQTNRTKNTSSNPILVIFGIIVAIALVLGPLLTLFE